MYNKTSCLQFDNGSFEVLEIANDVISLQPGNKQKPTGFKREANT